MKNVCVFCASSEKIPSEYRAAARNLGRLMAENELTLVYGGTTIGLMGELARAVHEHGGRVKGVIPQLIFDKGIAYDQADELIITSDMRERKACMEQLSDAFIALPGGFGTLEELSEAITHKQLQYHNKPVVLINTLGFFDPLNAFFEQFFELQISKPFYRELYHFANSPQAALQYIREYKWQPAENKWY